MKRRCVVILGGSFDPVHNGHIAVAAYFTRLFCADELRVIPAGNPWQKPALQVADQHRLTMLSRAFEDFFLQNTLAAPVVIDPQEMTRYQQQQTPTYTIETLQVLRAELGSNVSLIWILGADQLQHLDTWREWQRLFEYAHLCVAARPGFSLVGSGLPAAVTAEFFRRAAKPQTFCQYAHGFTYMAAELTENISSTKIRAHLAAGLSVDGCLPPRVLDYIQQHHLYQNS